MDFIEFGPMMWCKLGRAVRGMSARCRALQHSAWDLPDLGVGASALAYVHCETTRVEHGS